MRVRLKQGAAAAASRGHPWVYREGVQKAPALSSGTVVDAHDEAGRFVARGLWDAEGPIALRLFSRSPGELLDERSLAARVEHALRLRDDLFGEGGSRAAHEEATTAYRMCNGEGDRVPGLVLDRYGEVAVLRLDGGALVPWLDRLLPPVAAAVARRGVASIVQRLERGAPGERRIRALHGPPPPDRIVVREAGMAMEVDLAHGQKTGAFLDQRDNRARVRRLSKGRARVLNLFSYAGGFSIAAALGGARHVTSVDSAAAAHATAQRSFRANGLDPTRHAFVSADVFAWLDQAAARGERFDLVVCDPPSFAPSERARGGALRAYQRLHAAVARVLDERALLFAASCSSHVGPEDFLSTLDDAALGGRAMRLLGLFGQPADHPTTPAWPEGRYLKAALLG